LLCFAGVRSAAPGKADRAARAGVRYCRGEEQRKSAASSSPGSASSSPSLLALPSHCACCERLALRHTSRFLPPAAALWHLPPGLFAVLLGFAGLSPSCASLVFRDPSAGGARLRRASR
jgi:hypothetical protein